MLTLVDRISELALAPVVTAENFAVAVGDALANVLDFGIDSVVRDHSVDDHHRFVLSHNESLWSIARKPTLAPGGFRLKSVRQI